MPRQAIIIITVSFFIFFSAFVYEIYVPHPKSKEKREVQISQGLGSRKIGELLTDKGVIRSKWAFIVYISLSGKASALKPGTYTFFEATIPKIAQDLVAGEAREKLITIPEGWSSADIGAYLEKEKIITLLDFQKATHVSQAKIFEEKFSFLKERPAGAGLEGFLFPDTYRIFKDAKPEEIAGKMLENFGRKLNPSLRAEIARQKKSIFEIVTMASLIEKEVVSDEDRAIVSGILWKRLNLGIALQVDASIVYITGNKKVSLNDLQAKSPYNTYRNRGLPIGPISNPGLSAIKAAIYPKPSPYLYYLSAPDGQTIFSKTLEEHNEAKAKYLR